MSIYRARLRNTSNALCYLYKTQVKHALCHQFISQVFHCHIYHYTVESHNQPVCSAGHIVVNGVVKTLLHYTVWLLQHSAEWSHQHVLACGDVTKIPRGPVGQWHH